MSARRAMTSSNQCENTTSASTTPERLPHGRAATSPNNAATIEGLRSLPARSS
jgi:hypothetical protein